jgi:hypothetical protein
MSRRLLVLFAFAILSPGCVPVTEPVGDIAKAEPDKELVGTWSVTDAGETAKGFDVKAIIVDAPEVKGNPKGLMRAITKEKNFPDKTSDTWFYTTTVGKHTYMSLVLGVKDQNAPPRFDEEGTFEKWQKAENKRYFVFRYARAGDQLTLDCGNFVTFIELVKDAKIKGDGQQPLEFYNTPAGWLAKYLDKTGPDKLFDKTNYLALKREKK